MGSAPRRSARARRSGTMSTARIARRAEERSALHRHDADGSEPHHHDGRARGDGGAAGADVAGGQDVGQEHGLLVGHALGDGQREGVRARDRQGLGLAAGQVGDRPERLRFPPQTEVGPAAQARAALTAADDTRDEHAVAYPQRSYMSADLGHGADRLVAEPDARPGRGVVVQVQIRPADGGALDRDDRPGRPRKNGVGHLFDADPARTLEDGRSHARTLSERSTNYTAPVRSP